MIEGVIKINIIKRKILVRLLLKYERTKSKRRRKIIFFLNSKKTYRKKRKNSKNDRNKNKKTKPATPAFPHFQLNFNK